MRRVILLGLLSVMALLGVAAKPAAITQVTVAQLEQALTAASAAHKKDAAIASMIGGMELSERLTDATLERLSANLKARSKAAQALRLLADQSTFLEAPASELPDAPAPDDAAQKRFLKGAQNYVVQTLLQLPNFLATQTVKRYDNRGVGPGRSDLRLEETSRQEISTRATPQEQVFLNRLVSWGEFGSVAAVVLLNDTDHSTVTWSHWEHTPAGLAAVFHYSVPKSASHFEVGNTTVQGYAGIMGSYGHPESILQPTRSGAAYVTGARSKSGYSGSLWLDPSTGTVLRITIQADPKDISPQYTLTAMMVNYGPVRIGDDDFICPLRSLNRVDIKEKVPGDIPTTEWLSETLFTGYHHFKATAQILPDGPEPKSEPSHYEYSQPSRPAQETSAKTTSPAQPQPAGQEQEPKQDINLNPPNSTPILQEETPAQAGKSQPPVQGPNSAETENRAMALFDQKNYALAGPLFDQACGAGNGPACNQLGWMYQNKLGVDQDYSRAVKLYAKACDADNASGCNNLGGMYQYELGVKKDYPAAVRFYSKACDAGNASGCHNLGNMYQNGWGVKEDDHRAVELHTKACDAGNASGCNDLGIMYESGWGVVPDFPRSATLYAKACDAGFANGCSGLGYEYLLGQGVDKDIKKGKQLLKKGCDMGNKWGCEKLKEFEGSEEMKEIE